MISLIVCLLLVSIILYILLSYDIKIRLLDEETEESKEIDNEDRNNI